MPGESTDLQQVTREELYENLWTAPLPQVAEKYGLADAGLVRLCKKYSIPRPPAGYLEKMAGGQAVARIPLPVLRDRWSQVLDLAHLLAIGDGLARELRDPELARLAREEREGARPIEVAATLRSPHPLVARTLDSLETAVRSCRYKRDEELLGPACESCGRCLDVYVSKANTKRAMRIMDALVRACEERGYTFVPPAGQGSGGLRLACLGEIFELRLREPTRRTGLKDSVGWSQYALTGQLRLELKNEGSSFDIYTLQDTANTKIEDKLSRLMPAILREVDQQRQRTAYWEERKRAEKELERRQQEEQERRKREEADRKSLLEQVAAWRRTQDLREYIAAVRKVVIERGQVVEPGSQMDKWLRWAEDVAESMDPLSPRQHANQGTR